MGNLPNFDHGRRSTETTSKTSADEQYASEVVPVALRPYLTAYVNLCWVIGQLIASGVLRGVLDWQSEWAFRVPFALQCKSELVIMGTRADRQGSGLLSSWFHACLLPTLHGGSFEKAGSMLHETLFDDFEVAEVKRKLNRKFHSCSIPMLTRRLSEREQVTSHVSKVSISDEPKSLWELGSVKIGVVLHSWDGRPTSLNGLDSLLVTHSR